MQDVLNQLSTPAAIILIAVGVVILVIIVILARRIFRNQSPREGAAGLPDLDDSGSSIDYTSIPIDEEPKSWRERFTNLSLAGKILLAVIPLLIIAAVVVMALALSPDDPPPPPPATPIPVAMTITKADLIRIDPQQTIAIEVEISGIADGTEARVELIEADQPLAWFELESAVATVRQNSVEFSLQRSNDAPTPNCDETQTAVVTITANGEDLVDELAVTIPSIYKSAYCGSTTAQADTPVPDEPKPTPTAEAPTPEPTASATPESAPGIPVTVGNGGRVRRLPIVVSGNEVTLIDPGDTVEVLEKTPNEEWFRIRTPDGQEGWSSGSLLNLDPETIAQTPVATIVTVFVAGSIHELPNEESPVLGPVNVNEIVVLLEKTADSTWYKITDIRDVTGWVRADLLGIPDNVDTQVPLQGQEAATGTGLPPLTSGVTPTPEITTPAGLTAPVVNGGRVRAEPIIEEGNELDTINAGENVELFAKTDDGTWYRVRTERNIVGWVNFTLLRVAPEVAAKVPVYTEASEETPTPEETVEPEEEGDEPLPPEATG